MVTDAMIERGPSSPSSSAAPRFSAASAFMALFVYPIVGPGALVLVMVLPLATIGLFALGPGGVIYYLVLASWWLGEIYQLLAPPFLLTGLLVGLSGRTGARAPLLVAVAATEIAFFVYFGFWQLVPGGVAAVLHDYANLWSGFSASPWSAVAVLPGTIAGWYVCRRLAPPASAAAPRSKPLAAGAIGIAVIFGVGFGQVLLSDTRRPERAWKDCLAGDQQDNIRGCTAIIDRGAEEALDRRVTAYLRRGHARDNFSRDLVGAIADYTDAIRLDPTNANAFVSRGMAHARRGEDDRVIADIEEALRLNPGLADPDHYRMFRARGQALVRKGQFDRAIDDHTTEIKLSPRYADGYLNRGAAYLAKGDADRAITDFTEAIRIEPFHPRSYIARGAVYLAKGDNERALADFDEAIRRLPNHRLTAPAYRGRGEVLERTQKLTEALAAFETAVALNAQDQPSLAGRNRVRQALQR